MKKAIQIICPHNNAGLTRDRDILKLLLEKDYNVTISDSRNISEEAFHIDIHVEHLLKINKNSKHRILIPNPEWFELGWKPMLKDITIVFAKTKDCQFIFGKLHPYVKYTSFTSFDRYLPEVEKEFSFYHSCGKSQSKGTQAIIELWGRFKREPYPPLQLYARPEMIEWRAIKSGPLKNVSSHYDFIPDKEFQIEQNKNLIHVCTSIYEGFGHYINEAKSCGNVVVTTNAFPMKELIKPEYGFLSECIPFSKMMMAQTYKTYARHLRVAINKVVKTDKDRLIEMGQLARKSFLENDIYFKNRFMDIINKLK